MAARRLLAFVAASCALAPTARAQDPRAHTLAGTFRTHKAFHSRHLPTDRDILVYLPPGYEAQTARRYPVLYMHDGQNVFDGATSFIPGKEWRMDEAAESLIRAGTIEPLIIVAVSNAGARRNDEYLPVKDARGMGGDAPLYGRLLVEELKPFIDARYRTLRDARNTAVGGSSLGGLVSLYLGLQYPHVFGRLMVVSPSVWWNDMDFVRRVQQVRAKPAQRIWLDTGTQEGGDAREQAGTVFLARILRDTLIARGWTLNKDLKYMEAQGAGHNEEAWAARAPAMLRFLFPAPVPTPAKPVRPRAGK